MDNQYLDISEYKESEYMDNFGLPWERPLMTSDDFGRFSTYLPTYVRFGPI